MPRRPPIVWASGKKRFRHSARNRVAVKAIALYKHAPKYRTVHCYDDDYYYYHRR